MSNEFEKYPELTNYIREYASFGHFSNWSGFLAELNLLLSKLPPPADDIPAFHNEPVTFLLSNALRHLSPEQLIQLRDALIERTPANQGNSLK